jgi:hypothetical protein
VRREGRLDPNSIVDKRVRVRATASCTVRVSARESNDRGATFQKDVDRGRVYDLGMGEVPEALAAWFQESQLVLPPLPKSLLENFREQREYVFSTRDVTPSPYGWHDYVAEALSPLIDDYVLIAHDGRGSNSHALSYYIAFSGWRILLQIPWGGVYVDEAEARGQVNRTFERLRKLWPALRKQDRSSSPVVIASSGFYGERFARNGVYVEGDEQLDVDGFSRAMSRLQQEIGQGLSAPATLGPQYAHDDVFRARARLHQSRFRLERLGLKDWRDYGNRLTKQDALASYNFYREWPGLCELVQSRFPLRDSALYSDMLRSQHMPFNLFGPLALELSQPHTLEMIRLLAPDVMEVKAILFEHAPPKAAALLGDKTCFDVYVEYVAHDGANCAVGVEVKYTEGPAGYGKLERARMFAADSVYHRLTTASEIYIADAIPRLRKKDLKQLWREHLLGVALGVERFRLAVLGPHRNPQLALAVEDYRKQLLFTHRDHVLLISLEQWIATARHIATSPARIAWAEYLAARYGEALAELPVVLNLDRVQRADKGYPATDAARRLDWSAMPDVTTRADMNRLGQAIDGYDVAPRLGFGDCGSLANERRREFTATGQYRGLASELWCCLFFEARRFRHTDWPGRKPDEDLDVWVALYSALLGQLRAEDGSVTRHNSWMMIWRGYGAAPR